MSVAQTISVPNIVFEIRIYRRDNILLCACVHLLHSPNLNKEVSKQAKSSHSSDSFLSPFSERYASRDAYCRVIDLLISQFYPPWRGREMLSMVDLQMCVGITNEFPFKSWFWAKFFVHIYLCITLFLMHETYTKVHI